VHDLKNPLTAVVANLDLLERKLDDADARHLVARCRAGASRMHRMILDLLDVAGLEEGKLLLRLEDTDAVAVARRAIEDAEAAAHQRDIVLALDAAGPCPVRADASVLGRVFDNLIANAVEHSSRGGRVTVRLAGCDEGIGIDVADEGPGIPEEHRERIFEKFARLELRKAGFGGNRGLGLTFCRLAVEAHGGTIWVDAAPGGGALFRAILPAIEGPVAAVSLA
jgi:signal transduction histidine kinase